MSPAGRPAALPPPGWVPSTRRDGLRVEFVSEDGRQRKWYDFARAGGHPQVLEELAAAFETATGPLGTYKRAQSARNLWATASKTARWLQENRAGLSSLSQLGKLDARALASALVTPSGDHRVVVLRSLLGFSPMVGRECLEEMARLRFGRRTEARQPYTIEEARRIAVVARGMVRRARTRIRGGWAIVTSYRQGGFDGLDDLDPHRSLAEVLDHCARTGDYPRSAATGKYAPISKRAADAVDGRGLLPMLHLTAGEIWAFAVLLAGLTGYNASMLDELPAPSFRATAPGEPAIELLRLSKPRRGARSEMTLPLDTVPRAFLPAPEDMRLEPVRQTSLTSALGVFTLLIELSTPARQQLGSDGALAYYSGHPGEAGGSVLRAGLPQIFRSQRSRWLRPWLSGDPVHDELLLGISLDRLRKTHLERNRRPVAHTPDTLTRYLRRMNRVTQEGFQIVRNALDDEVAKALQRRKMIITTDTGRAEQAACGTQDTVLGACTDFDHAPDDGGGRCRRSFLHCLDCSNARGFPQHLPMQLLVLDELRARHTVASVRQRVGEFAGRIAQLAGIVEEYEPAQRAQARALITDDHRHLAARLFAGELDAL